MFKLYLQSLNIDQIENNFSLLILWSKSTFRAHRIIIFKKSRFSFHPIEHVWIFSISEWVLTNFEESWRNLRLKGFILGDYRNWKFESIKSKKQNLISRSFEVQYEADHSSVLPNGLNGRLRSTSFKLKIGWLWILIRCVLSSVSFFN